MRFKSCTLFPMGIYAARHEEACSCCGAPATVIGAWLSAGDPVAIPVCEEHRPMIEPMQHCDSVRFTSTGEMKISGAFVPKPEEEVEDENVAELFPFDWPVDSRHHRSQNVAVQLDMFGGAA